MRISTVFGSTFWPWIRLIFHYTNELYEWISNCKNVGAKQQSEFHCNAYKIYVLSIHLHTALGYCVMRTRFHVHCSRLGERFHYTERWMPHSNIPKHNEKVHIKKMAILKRAYNAFFGSFFSSLQKSVSIINNCSERW